MVEGPGVAEVMDVLCILSSRDAAEKFGSAFVNGTGYVSFLRGLDASERGNRGHAVDMEFRLAWLACLEPR